MEGMNEHYLEELNQSQRDAVLYIDGPSLVIAGAGSGKTRVLTYKIAYLLEQGLKAWDILALTFTNKAAREMQERIATIVGSQVARRLWMGTFHSVFYRILRAESEHLGFSSKLTIYDTSDSRSLIRSIIKEMQLDEKQYKPATVQARISNAKNHLLSPSAYASHKSLYEGDAAAKMPAIRDIYKRYWNRCRQADAMDFDDLLFYTFILFNEQPTILAKYQERFKYILVDEYQDTNFAQHCVVRQLAGKHQKVCVVGDDAQSIYSFRGANIDNILEFSNTFAGAKVFKLEQNYRSTQNIVAAANSLIQKNRRQIPKEVFSEKKEGERVQLIEAYSDIEEAEIVAKRIAELRRAKDYDYADYAVLYRTNAQSRVFEEVFRKRGIPHKIYGGLSFYQRKEIKDIISYFRLVVNPNDEEALKRIINYPARGIGATTLSRIADAASRHEVSFWSVVCQPLAYNLEVNKGIQKKLSNFADLITAFQAEIETKDAYELGTQIIKETGIILDVLQDNSPESISRKENVEELSNGLKEFCVSRREEEAGGVSLYDYLSEVSLLTDQDSESEEDIDKVTLMTVHSAKGLEFKNVFVVGLEENLFPSNMSGDNPGAIEEERRLFYVALTRAEEQCFLSFAKSRMRYGKMEFGAPSRFIREIDSQYLDYPHGIALGQQVELVGANFRQKMLEPQRFTKPKTSNIQSGRSLKRVGGLPPSRNSAVIPSSLGVGSSVEHERFGVGVVKHLEGEGDNAKATVEFEHAGTKQLLLRFARFKVLD